MKGLLSCYFLILSAVTYAQIKSPALPTYSSYQPSVGNLSANNTTTTYYQQPTQVKMGATAQDVINRQSPQVMSSVNKSREEVEKLIRENNQENRRYYPQPYKPNDTDLAIIRNFQSTLNHLNDMLEGRAKLSLADAYFTIENAYGKNYLNRKQYDQIIHESADFIRAWMKQNKLDPHDNYMVQYAIQKFMSEPLTIEKTTKSRDGSPKIEVATHKPFGYDYKDNQAFEDRRDMFLTKCLATGFGQCGSMPEVYLVLAEALGVKAYWSLAPQHGLVKYPDNSGHILNYEPTSNWEISDNWYKDNLFISPVAIRNGVYLDTLNTRQIVANCIFDLALEYMAVDRTGNDDVVIACLRSGTKYFPKNNNLEPLFIYSMYLKTHLREDMRAKGIIRIEDVERYPNLKKLYQEYLGNEAYITQLGYQDMPAGLYDDLLKTDEFKRKVQVNTKVNTKETRNLFIY